MRDDKPILEQGEAYPQWIDVLHVPDSIGFCARLRFTPSTSASAASISRGKKQSPNEENVKQSLSFEKDGGVFGKKMRINGPVFTAHENFFPRIREITYEKLTHIICSALLMDAVYVPRQVTLDHERLVHTFRQ